MQGPKQTFKHLKKEKVHHRTPSAQRVLRVPTPDNLQFAGEAPLCRDTKALNWVMLWSQLKSSATRALSRPQRKCNKIAQQTLFADQQCRRSEGKQYATKSTATRTLSIPLRQPHQDRPAYSRCRLRSEGNQYETISPATRTLIVPNSRC